MAIPLMAIIAVSGFSLFADAATTTKLTTLSSDGDSFYNYDFLSDSSASSNNVDWPITMLHYNDAEVDKVKDIYYGASIASQKHARMNDGGWTWDSDLGTKSGIFWSDSLGEYVYIHQRVYAPNPPDYLSNTPWGNYVISSTHYDDYPLEAWSGYSENAEDDFALIASASYTVFEDWSNFSNSEPYREENNGSHIWLNDGFATAVNVP